MTRAFDMAVTAYVASRIGSLASGLDTSYKTPRAGEVGGTDFLRNDPRDSLLEKMGLAERCYELQGRKGRDTIVSVSLTGRGREFMETGEVDTTILADKMRVFVGTTKFIERSDCPERCVELNALADMGALAKTRTADGRRGRVPRDVYVPTQTGLAYIRELEQQLGTPEQIADAGTATII